MLNSLLKSSVLVFAVNLLILTQLEYMFAQTAKGLTECERERVQRVIRSLDETNLLRLALESGTTGNNTHEPWMDFMNSLSVRHAAFVFEYDSKPSGNDLRVKSATYYHRYFDFDHPIRSEWMPIIEKSGLDKTLTNEATAVAKRILNITLSNFRTQHPDLVKGGERLCGMVFVNLLDDEILPTLDRLPTVESDCNK